MYNLSDKVLKEIPPKTLIQEREIWFTALRSNTQNLCVTDHGAGSKQLGKERRIQQLFRISSSKGKYGWLLYRLSKNYQPATILELGTSIGVGTWHLHKGNPNASIYTIEGCPETHQFAKSELKHLPGVQCIQATFDAFLENVPEPTFDMVFIDGHHSGSALLAYIKKILPFVHDETLLILDDIRWSVDMLDAWYSIVNSNEFNVTIDLFRMGIVSIRKHQQKEHFIVRY